MKKAFTIVELLVVMAVIGILITLAVVGIQAIQKAQRETSRLNDLRSVQSTLEAYYSKFKYYPIATAQTVANSATQNLKYDTATGTITFYEKDGSTVTTFSTTPQQKGLMAQSATAGQGGLRIHGTTYAAITTCLTDGSAQAATPDQWQIYYKTGSGTPQSYALGACTENGMSANLGPKAD